MRNSRQQLAAELRGRLSTRWVVHDAPRNIGPIDGATTEAVAVVVRERRTPAPNVQGSVIETFSIYVIAPTIDPDDSEDWLDDAAEVVETAVQRLGSWVEWESSERVTWADTYPAYQLTVNLIASVTNNSTTEQE